jgi:hypothetical protein
MKKKSYNHFHPNLSQSTIMLPFGAKQSNIAKYSFPSRKRENYKSSQRDKSLL